MNIFNAGEILKVAIQIEKNGLAFYNQIKDGSKNLAVKEVFGFLAGEEEKHRVTFQKLLEQAGNYEPAESYPGEYELYLEALAADNIFKKEADLKKVAQGVSSDAQAIDLGIGFEKDSIVFYNEMKNFVPAEEIPVIEKVISEEKDHLVKLFNLRGAAKGLS